MRGLRYSLAFHILLLGICRGAGSLQPEEIKARQIRLVKCEELGGPHPFREYRSASPHILYSPQPEFFLKSEINLHANSTVDTPSTEISEAGFARPESGTR